MRALLVVPRLPGTGYTGDRLRAEIHLQALARAGFDVVLVGGAPPGRSGRAIQGAAEIHPVLLFPVRVPFSAARAFFSGAPLQTGLFSGAWRSALARAGDVALSVVLLPARLWPHVSPWLPRAPLVLDYVDALGEAARQAAVSDPSPLRRLVWRLEAPRLVRAEREAARRAAALVATTDFDASLLPPGTAVVPNGVPIGPPAPPARGPLVVFSGRLRYRPNGLAARRLLKTIWPRVAREVPEASLVLGGADAPPELRRACQTGGIRVESPVADMPAFLRAARVAAVPVGLGTGTPNKLFEAFEAGAAVVASEEVVARATLDGVVPPARIGRTDEEIALHLIEYLRDADTAAADGRRGRAFVEAYADRRRTLEALGSLYRRALEGQP